VNPLRRRLLVGCVLLLFAPRRVRAAGSTDDLLVRIARARAPVRTLKGGFTQTRTIGLLSTEVRSVGKLVLVRPDRLRWELRPPDDVTFWAGPEGLSYRSAHGHGRLAATSARIGAALEDLHAVLSGDLASLRARWSLSVLRDDASGAEIEATLRATDASTGDPRAERRMRFALGSDLVRPTRALLVEGEHDRTVIEFGELVVNAPVDETEMRPPV
jgi:hypothetical protein